MHGATAPFPGAGRSREAPARAAHVQADSPAQGPSSPEQPAALPAAGTQMHDEVIAWFAHEGRDLPWRHAGTSSWAVLVSEVMLQQTPVIRVLPRWREWMERWPHPAALADAPTADVLRCWDRLGYPRRALRLRECARAIVREHGGEVPQGEEVLRSLPGIGEYTAAAVSAFAHHRRAVVVDTNIRRVLARSVLGVALPDRSYSAAERALATRSLPLGRERSVAWNAAVMELGALVCTARSPRCEHCPLAGAGCAWFAAGRPAPVVDTRRRQAFEGTDRQMRGQIMAVLRRDGRADRERLLALDAEDPHRVQRCAATLVTDGLAVRDHAGLRLP